MNKWEPPNVEARKFYDMLASANELVYDRTTDIGSHYAFGLYNQLAYDRKMFR